MRATLNVIAGSVRVYSTEDDKRPASKPAPVEAPYSEELDGEWAVGSATVKGEVTSGKFEIVAQEDGVLTVYTEAKDAFGAVIPSSGSTKVSLTTGGIYVGTTHESNAYTVESIEAYRAEQHA